ncbi:hypothetical protein K443DRAFT_679392 [Laccaria amethystina LaAM-08-1]|uniref:F-box domain-containing protein n=1 Tax=Laccaria amethystina LaAM-08-1 TaxID=1095629 RepID=A0A0C9XR02_9AGAR|nr:hypothetical protein K443DRAFT_679392 [Laccaria amethystina LaAM-08-1]
MPSALTYPTKGEILLPQLFNELAREMCGSPVRGKPLFSEVYLDHPTRAAAHCDKLLHLVQHSRDFAESIKTVYITEHPTTDDGASCSWLTTENSLPQLLSSLESLSALSISCSSGYLEWRTLPIKLSTSFSSLFKKVTSLQLSSVEGVPIAPMSFSRLEHLGLNDVTPGKMHPLDLTFFDQSHEIKKRSLSSLSVINSLSAMKELFDCLSHSNSRLDLSLLHFLEIGFSKDEEMEGACLTLSAVSQSIRHLDVQHVLPTAFDSREFPLKSLNLHQFPNLLSLSHSVDYFYLACPSENDHNPLPSLLNQLRQISNQSKIQSFNLYLDLTGITADTNSITSDVEVEVIDTTLLKLCYDEIWGHLGQTLANFPELEEVSISVETRDAYAEIYEKFCLGLRESLDELSGSGIRLMFTIQSSTCQ